MNAPDLLTALLDTGTYRSTDLAAHGIVDHVVAETSTAQLCRDLGHLLHAELQLLTTWDDDTRMARRLRRYRHLGMPPVRQ